MRGDMTVQKTPSVNGLAQAPRFVIQGAMIAGADYGSVARRDAERSFRVAMNAAALRAIAPEAQPGDEVPVRFKMTMNRVEDEGQIGGRVYVMVPAGDREPHGVIRVRK